MGYFSICNSKHLRRSYMAKTKFISLGLVLIMIFSLLTGCSNIKYNAQLFDSATDWIKEEFINDNLVGYSEDDSYPAERVFAVKNQEEYDEIFIESIDDFDVDFGTQMLIVYTFETIYHRKNNLVSLDVKEDVLNITYKMDKKSGVGDASQPYQRWFVVRLDKLDVDSVVFVEKE